MDSTEKSYVAGEKTFTSLTQALNYCLRKGFNFDARRLISTAETRVDLIGAFKVCLDANRFEFIETIMSRDLLYKQDKLFFLKRSINEDKIECLKEILKQPSVGIGQNDDLLSFPILRHFNDIVELLVNDNRANINTAEKIAFKVAKSSGNARATELLLGSKQNFPPAGAPAPAPTPAPAPAPVLKPKAVRFTPTEPAAPAAPTPRSVVTPRPRETFKEIRLEVIHPFGVKCGVIVRSQFRLRDLQKHLEEKIGHKLELFDSQHHLLEPNDFLVTDVDAFHTTPTVIAECVFDVNGTRVNFPCTRTNSVRLIDVVRSYPKLTVAELELMAETMSCDGMKCEFVKSGKPLPDFVEHMTLTDVEIREIAESPPADIACVFSLREFNVDFLEELAVAAISNGNCEILKSCGRHGLWRGTRNINFVLLAVENANETVLETVASLPGVNPGTDNSIAMIAAIALKKQRHQEILARDPRVTISEDGPLVHATRYGMVEYVTLLLQ